MFLTTPKTLNIFSISLFALSLASLTIFVVFNIVITSMPGYDSQWFFPVAYWHLFSNDLIHPVATPMSNGPGEYNYHGWLWPMLISKLSPTVTYTNVLLTSNILVITAFISFFLNSIRFSSFQIFALFSPIFTVLLSYQVNRPELLITNLLLIYFLISSIKNFKNIQSILEGLLWGLMFLTSPVTAVLISLLFVLDNFRLKESARHFVLKTLAQSLIAILVVIVATEIFTKFGISGWFAGLRDHASIINENKPDFSSFFTYYVVNHSFPAPFLVLCILLILNTSNIIQAKLHTLDKTFLWAGFGIILIFLLSQLMVIARVYVIISLLPFMWGSFVQIRNSLGRNSTKSFIYFCFGFLLLASMAILTRETLMRIDGIDRGVKPKVLISKLEEIRKKTPSQLKVYSNNSHVMMLLHSHYQSLNSLTLNSDEADLLILTQAHSGLRSPPDLVKYELIINNFHSSPPQFLNVPLGGTQKDWAFAFYIKK